MKKLIFMYFSLVSGVWGAMGDPEVGAGESMHSTIDLPIIYRPIIFTRIAEFLPGTDMCQLANCSRSLTHSNDKLIRDDFASCLNDMQDKSYLLPSKIDSLIFCYKVTEPNNDSKMISVPTRFCSNNYTKFILSIFCEHHLRKQGVELTKKIRIDFDYPTSCFNLERITELRGLIEQHQDKEMKQIVSNFLSSCLKVRKKYQEYRILYSDPKLPQLKYVVDEIGNFAYQNPENEIYAFIKNLKFKYRVLLDTATTNSPYIGHNKIAQAITEGKSVWVYVDDPESFLNLDNIDKIARLQSQVADFNEKARISLLIELMIYFRQKYLEQNAAQPLCFRLLKDYVLDNPLLIS